MGRNGRGEGERSRRMGSIAHCRIFCKSLSNLIHATNLEGGGITTTYIGLFFSK